MKKIWLIDIDGTVCEDIPNEEAYRFETAKPLPGALSRVLQLKSNGDRIAFFTARTIEHKEATESWLDKNGFPYESVVYNKPRIGDGEEYHWVDNRPVNSSFMIDGLTSEGEE